MARISGAPSIASDSAYSIPFSSQTIRTTRVYVDREEPMISGFGMAFLRTASACELRKAFEARRPAGVVAVARPLALESLLQQHQARAAVGRFEGHQDLGLVAPRPVLIFPGPS